MACGEYGEDKISLLVSAAENGKNLQWFKNSNTLLESNGLKSMFSFIV